MTLIKTVFTKTEILSLQFTYEHSEREVKSPTYNNRN